MANNNNNAPQLTSNEVKILTRLYKNNLKPEKVPISTSQILAGAAGAIPGAAIGGALGELLRGSIKNKKLKKILPILSIIGGGAGTGYLNLLWRRRVEGRREAMRQAWQKMTPKQRKELLIRAIAELQSAKKEGLGALAGLGTGLLAEGAAVAATGASPGLFPLAGVIAGRSLGKLSPEQRVELYNKLKKLSPEQLHQMFAALV